MTRTKSLMLVLVPLGLAGCVLFMGPADMPIRVSGTVSPAVAGPCSLRMVALPSHTVISQREVAATFETTFVYYLAAEAKSLSFELSCNGSQWVAVGPVMRLSEARAIPFPLGAISI